MGTIKMINFSIIQTLRIPLTAEDFAASAIINKYTVVKDGQVVTIPAPRSINESLVGLLTKRWDLLKTAKETAPSLSEIMSWIEKTVTNGSPERVYELFFRLGYRCTRDYFGNVTAITFQSYVRLCQTWEEEASSALIKELSKQPPVPQWANIQNITMYEKGIRVIPSEIGCCTQLQSLGLNGHMLSSLPAEIFKCCTGLTELYVLRSQLLSIPNEIGLCRRLRLLLLDENQLSSIPPGIEFCANLVVFSAAHNELEQIPLELGHCANLRGVTFCNNRIKEIPSVIRFWPLLDTLNLHNNKISKIPPQIRFCFSLRSLYLSNNRITSVPHEIGDCESLRDIDFSDNQISFLPDCIYTRLRLETLNLAGNPILTSLWAFDLFPT